MSFFVLLLILSSVLLSAVAQILLKIGMSVPSVQHAISVDSFSQVVYSIATSFYVLLGLGLYFASAAVWLFVLAKVDVSFAYPFVGLGFVVTMLLAFFINGEVLSTTKIVGTLCIALGVAIIAQG